MDVTVAELHQANLKYLRIPVSVEIETEVSDILIKKISSKKDINVRTAST